MNTISDRLTRKPEADDDLAERLPLGYKDPKSPFYVPDEPGLRRAVADFDPRAAELIRRDLIRRGSGDVIQRHGRQQHVVDPLDSDGELELAALWVTIERCRGQLHDARRNEATAANRALHFTCHACGTVRSPLGNSGVQPRRYADGTVAKLCAPCHAVAAQQILAKLTAETVNGRTRAQLVADLLGATP